MRECRSAGLRKTLLERRSVSPAAAARALQSPASPLRRQWAWLCSVPCRSRTEMLTAPARLSSLSPSFHPFPSVHASILPENMCGTSATSHPISHPPILTHLPSYVSKYSSACICLPVHPSTHLSIQSSFHPSVWLSILQSMACRTLSLQFMLRVFDRRASSVRLPSHSPLSALSSE